MDLLIYGANGFTGNLVSELCKKKKLTPILAGRDDQAVREVALPLGFKHIAFGVDSVPKLDGIRAILNCAGPFTKTAAPLINACLSQGIHYLDITGEISVFEQAHASSERAKTKGVVLIPGVGFDVVPTDCLSMNLKVAMPDANRLELAFWAHSSASRGTVKTMIENIPAGGKERINGKLESVSMFHKTKTVKFKSGSTSCASIPWGDLATAYFSTGIPNITVYSAHPPGFPLLGRMLYPYRKVLGARVFQTFLVKLADRFVRGPSIQEQQASLIDVWGKVSGPSGEIEKSIQVPEGYRFTAEAALESTLRVLSGKLEPGFAAGYATPAQAFGPEFLASLLIGWTPTPITIKTN